jgi:hypothetical protein
MAEPPFCQVPLSAHTNMSRIIITGHPSSGLEFVEELLLRSGMKPPLPSRRQGKLPVEICATLYKANDCPPLHEISTESELPTFEIGPVWNELILDLLLGNEDQDLWGWADPQSLLLLDHWRTVDHKSLFLLIYDEPQQALLQASRNSNAILEDYTIQQLLKKWLTSNTALLQFYKRHPEKCLLINSQAFRSQPNHCLSLLRDRLKKADVLTDVQEMTMSHTNPNGILGDSVHQALSSTTADPDATLWTIYAEPMERYIIHEYFEASPSYYKLYQKIESSSTCRSHSSSTASVSILDAWQSLQMQRHASGVVIQQALKKYHHISNVREHESKKRKEDTDWLYRVQDQLELTAEQNRQLESQCQDLRSQVSWYQSHISYLEGKNEAGLDQYGAADRVQKHLSYQLGKNMVHAERNIQGLLKIPIQMASTTRSFYREKSMVGDVKQPPLITYKDYAEAERMMRQLSYRLGHVVVKNSKSPIGWLKMPFLLISQFSYFRKCTIHR